MNFRTYQNRLFSPLRAAFTLVEVLVSMTVLIILLLVSAQVIGTVQNTWTTSNARVSQFREARTAFDIITRNLSQATLNTYLDYDFNYLSEDSGEATAAAAQAPQSYIRKSDLRFVCGNPTTLIDALGGEEDIAPGHAIFFQAPLGVAHDAAYVGLDRLLCGRGYFVQYTSDDFFRPGILPAGESRYRYRLMEFSPPAEQNLVYSGGNAWFSQAGVAQEEEDPANRSLTRPIADNIVALIISPQRDPTSSGGSPYDIAPSYSYDSNNNGPNQNLLPPLVRVVLIAIDERSADRLSQQSGSKPPFADLKISDNLSSAAELDQSLESISEGLRKARVNYRIFSATVTLRCAPPRSDP